MLCLFWTRWVYHLSNHKLILSRGSTKYQDDVILFHGDLAIIYRIVLGVQIINLYGELFLFEYRTKQIELDLDLK
jgi:hypothetical protein